jgi:hypothetical protein
VACSEYKDQWSIPFHRTHLPIRFPPGPGPAGIALVAVPLAIFFFGIPGAIVESFGKSWCSARSVVFCSLHFVCPIRASQHPFWVRPFCGVSAGYVFRQSGAIGLFILISGAPHSAFCPDIGRCPLPTDLFGRFQRLFLGKDTVFFEIPCASVDFFEAHSCMTK